MPDVLERDEIDVSKFASEVEAGLPNAIRDLDTARENQAFYDYDAERYLPRRDSESEFDYAGRDKRTSGLLRQACEALCSHLYNPGPVRSIEQETEADDFLRIVYEQNHINNLMHEADVMAAVNDVAAVQVDPGDGDFAERPLDLHLWGRDEFHAWLHPNNPKKVVAVVTIAKHDQQRVYKLWTGYEVLEYRTEKLKPAQTAGGTVAYLVSRDEHGFGCLPFAFVHYKFPAREFWTSGVGTHLRRAEVAFNDRLSRLNESIHKHLNPIPVAEDVPADWHPVIEPQRFIKLPSGASPFSGTGDYSGSGKARLSYLQAVIAVQDAWYDAEQWVKQSLESVGLPLSSVRMEQQQAASGIQILAEQAPLLTRAKARQNPAGCYETELARVALTVAGNHYGKPALAEAAKTLSLVLTWPEPAIPIPGPDRDDGDLWELNQGLTSRLMLIQKRYGCSRDQAVALLKQIKEDRDEELEIDPPQTINPDGSTTDHFAGTTEPAPTPAEPPPDDESAP